MKSLTTIRDARRAAGLSQQALAAQLGIQQSSLSRYEGGIVTPDADVLDAIAKALHVAPERLTLATSTGEDTQGEQAEVKPARGRRLTMPQAATYLGVTSRSLEGLVRDGLIPFHRYSATSRYYFYTNELDAFMASTSRQAPAVARREKPQRAAARQPVPGNIARHMPATRELR